MVVILLILHSKNDYSETTIGCVEGMMLWEDKLMTVETVMASILRACSKIKMKTQSSPLIHGGYRPRSPVDGCLKPGGTRLCTYYAFSYMYVAMIKVR